MIRAKLGSSYSRNGRWLVEYRSDYVQRREATAGTLWLKGTVGTGKTSLVSIVIEDLGEKFESDSLAFFYCGGLTATKSEPLTVLRSLLAQLACSDNGIDISEHVRHLYESREQRLQRTNPRADVRDCTELLSKVVQERVSAIIVVDGLDECSRPMELLDSFSKIIAEIGNDNAQLRIFLSSRMDVEEQKWMEEFLQPKIISIISAETSDDIRTFIHTERNKASRRPDPTIIPHAMTQDMENSLFRLASGT